MTEAGISADPAQSNRSTSFGAGGVLAIILRRLGEIRRAAAAFFRPSHPESEVRDESGVAETEDAAAAVSPAADATAAALFRASHPESTEVQDESGVAETEDAAAAVSPAADATAAALFRPSHPESTEVQDESDVAETEDAATAVSPAADANIDRPQIAALADFVPDQPEIDRRRNLVRIYFNDFWSEVPHKPAGFAERLDAAEEYLNERLAANGEFWRLDATMRVTLGLPARSKSSVGRPASG